MDCLKAQICITSYIDGGLSWNERKEFLLHVKSCPNCREELEIYYTLMEATRQLDEGLLTTNDFMKELEDKINRELSEIRGKEERRSRRKFLAFLISCCIGTVALIRWMDLPIPWINPPKITWEEEKECMTQYMLPYLYHAPSKK